MTTEPSGARVTHPRPPGSRARARLGAWWIPGLAMTVGLLLIALNQIKAGGVVAAGGFAVAALIRAVVDPESSGALPIRSRLLDVVMYVAMGAILLVAVLAVRLDGNP